MFCISKLFTTFPDKPRSLFFLPRAFVSLMLWFFSWPPSLVSQPTSGSNMCEAPSPILTAPQTGCMFSPLSLPLSRGQGILSILMAAVSWDPRTVCDNSMQAFIKYWVSKETKEKQTSTAAGVRRGSPGWTQVGRFHSLSKNSALLPLHVIYKQLPSRLHFTLFTNSFPLD